MGLLVFVPDPPARAVLGTMMSCACTHAEAMMFACAHEQRNPHVERRATILARDGRGVLLDVLLLPRPADNPRGPT